MYRGSYIRTADGTVRPTLAGLLALGTYPQQFFPQLSITFTHYRGTTKASDAAGIRYIDTLTIEGPIPLLIEEATRKVQEASPRGAIMRGALAHAHSIAHSKLAANTSTREVIVDYLRTHDSASTKELADAAGVTAETMRRNLRQLLTENLVSTTAPQRSPKQRYQLAQQASASAFS